MVDKKIQEEFEERLLEEKKKLEKELDRIAKKEDGDYEAKYEDYGREREDNAEEIEDYTVRVGLTESLEKELENVENALQKIKNGTYGFCENCKEEIPIERLRAYPAARQCVKCKSKNEQ